MKTWARKILETHGSFLTGGKELLPLSSLFFTIFDIPDSFPDTGRISYCEKEEGIPWFYVSGDTGMGGSSSVECIHRKTSSHVRVYCKQHTQVLSPTDCWPSCVTTLWEKHHLRERNSSLH